MKLLVPIALNCLLVLAVFIIEKYTSFKKLPYLAKQLIIGLMFGAVSAFSSDFGVDLLGTTANVRDAAPLNAGLIFGAPSGIIAGLIGGLYRWFSVAWGAGEYTRLACTLGTILAGLMAAALRKFMFENKRPTWGYGICITLVCEVVHMMLILLTNMDDSAYAFEFVRGATTPMLIGNTLAVGVSLIFVSLLSHERLIQKRKGERIAQTFQRWLLSCIVLAFLATSAFTYFLQSGMAQLETENLFKTAIADVQKDISNKSDEYMMELVEEVARQYREKPSTPLSLLADTNGVIEINIIDDKGLIIHSTDKSVMGTFDMYSTDQSKDFMENMVEFGQYVQDYRPMGNDESVMRKFAGTVLFEGTYIQIGYSAEQFHKMLDGFVIDVTKNRHVGTSGFIAVCNEEMKLVTDDPEYNGRGLDAIGITPGEEMLSGVHPEELLETTISVDVLDYSEEHIYAYTFVEGYCIIAAIPKGEAMATRDASIYNTLFLQVLVFATLFIFIYILIKRVIINNLRKVNTSLGEITEGNLDVTVDVRSNAEFASLSDDINSTVATLKRYIAEAAARIDRELEYAKQIQHSALPANFPERDNYGIHAQMIAAKEVGGDFYDFYRINDKNVAFLVADVSGKGIPAAMFMMTAKTIIKDLAERGLSVDAILTQANEKLCENNESGMFVTAWMGILDIETGKLQYANAGHNPPLIKRGGGNFEYLKSHAGLVLAGMEGIRYRINELNLCAGDRIFLYTDGVTEATDLDNKLYGEERLADFMNKNANTKARDLLPALKADIDRFIGEAPQFDDITMLVFDYKFSKEGRNMKSVIKMNYPAKTDVLGELISFVEEKLEDFECPMKMTMSICVAIEEVFVNVANYAYGDGEGEVFFSVDFDTETREVTFVMEDRGTPFDPLANPDPDVTLSADERQIGGLGIFITKKTMDSVSYAYENGKNILTMIKKI